MGNMGELSVLLIGVVDALFAFFVVAPIMLNTASLFGVQKRFAQAMVEEGVIDAETVKLLHPKKQIAGVLISVVHWAAETGVTGGTAEGAFAAARHLTWQEAAVFLVRTVEALGLEPEAVRTAPLPDALAEGAWDQTALELAWEWGLLPEDAGSAAEIARVQGGAMADAFAALL